MKKELLENIFKELERMDPDYRKKVARPLLAPRSLPFYGAPEDDDGLPISERSSANERHCRFPWDL